MKIMTLIRNVALFLVVSVLIGILLIVLLNSEEVASNDQHNSRRAIEEAELVNDDTEQKGREADVPLGHANTSEFDDLVESFAHYTGNEIAMAMFTDGRLIDSGAELLLALVENGTLGINQPLRQSTQMSNSHYTPLFVALASRDELDHEQFSAFLELGAYIDTSNPWMRSLGNVRDTRIIETWIAEAKVGPEHFQQLMNYALTFGSPGLAQVTNEMYGNDALYNIDEQVINEVVPTITSYAEDQNYDERTYESAFSRISNVSMLATDLALGKKMLGRAQVIQQHSLTNDSQNIEIESLVNILQVRVNRLQEIKDRMGLRNSFSP